MKNGSLKDKLQMQEQELKVSNKPLVPEIEPNEKKHRTNVGTDIQPNVQTFGQSNSQPVSQIAGQTNVLDIATSLFSILPTAADINPNPEDEFPLRKPKKKKRGRSLG